MARHWADQFMSTGNTRTNVGFQEEKQGRSLATSNASMLRQAIRTIQLELIAPMELVTEYSLGPVNWVQRKQSESNSVIVHLGMS